MDICRFHYFRFFCVLIASAWIWGPLSAPSAFAQKTVNLYFMDPSDTHLTAETRQIPETERIEQSARAILEALLTGPRQGLVRAIPEGLSLRTLFLTEEKIAYVDFQKNPDSRLERGVISEWLAIYSIVNSLVLNIPEIESVQILIDGHEVSTLSGHIDLTGPFKANMLLVR
jgi:spore germination protein GerM